MQVAVKVGQFLVIKVPQESLDLMGILHMDFIFIHWDMEGNGRAEMKKRKITVTECKKMQGCYTITIANARFGVRFSENIGEFLKAFFKTDKIFLGFYRIDGINLTFEEVKLRQQIPYLLQKWGKTENYNEYVSIAEAEASDMFYNYVPSIFDYYLDTILFNPKIDWNIFRRYYFDYQNCTYCHFIINDWAEIVFNYFDSGDFSIYYNPKKYAPEYMMVEKYLL